MGCHLPKSYIGLNNNLDTTTTTQKQNNLISRKGGNTVYFVNFKFHVCPSLT